VVKLALYLLYKYKKIGNQMATLNSNATTSQTAASAPADPLFASQETARTNAQRDLDLAQATNRGQSELDTLSKYENAGVVDLDGQYVDERAENRNKLLGLGQRSISGVPDGAELAPASGPSITFVDVMGNNLGKDLRVRIKVPPKYLVGLASPLSNQGGILFPYLPTISYDVSADYGNINTMHSNFTVSFYQRSKLSQININGKFTVQNEEDAVKYIASKFLLQALTKMRSGGAKSGDPDSGAPPPVCRLSGYGDMMFDNVPVSITNFRLELPDSVDYITTKISINGNTQVFSVPTLSTFAISCITMFSRNEMQGFSVDNYLNGNFSGKGFI
jgi:hypothetical protein